MIFEEEYIYAGKILKTHGYQGQFVITTESFIKGYLKQKEPIFIEIDGIPVPFFIEEINETSENTHRLKIYDINSDIDAEEFIGCKLFYTDKKNTAKNTNFDIHSLIGFTIKDIQSGKEGIIIDINEIPGNPLLKIQTNDKREYFIPYHYNLVNKMNIKKKILVMDLPSGLIE